MLTTTLDIIVSEQIEASPKLFFQAIEFIVREIKREPNGKGVKRCDTRTRCDIYSKLTIKIPERRQWHRYVVVIANFEHILHLVLVFLLLILNM